jgi:hypothetical protein
MNLDRLKEFRAGDLVYWDDPESDEESTEQRILEILSPSGIITSGKDLVVLSGSSSEGPNVVPARELH